MNEGEKSGKHEGKWYDDDGTSSVPQFAPACPVVFSLSFVFSAVFFFYPFRYAPTGLAHFLYTPDIFAMLVAGLLIHTYESMKVRTLKQGSRRSSHPLSPYPHSRLIPFRSLLDVLALFLHGYFINNRHIKYLCHVLAPCFKSNQLKFCRLLICRWIFSVWPVY